MPVTKVQVPDRANRTSEIVTLEYTDFGMVAKSAVKVDPEKIIDRDSEAEIQMLEDSLTRFGNDTNKG